MALLVASASRCATTIAPAADLPHENRLDVDTTVCVPASPAAKGSELGATITIRRASAVPRSVLTTDFVIPRSSKSADSQVSTGTPTLRNFDPTNPDVTVEEITTKRFPVASEVADDESFFTETVNPSAYSRCLTALSPAFNVVLPTTKSALRTARESDDNAISGSGTPPHWSAPAIKKQVNAWRRRAGVLSMLVPV